MRDLKSVLKIQSYSHKQHLMFKFIEDALVEAKVPYYTHNGCIYATKGESKTYPCVVAHMDTVHPLCEDLSILEVGGKLTGFNTVTMTQTGIGGDDKVGVYVALQCLESIENIKVVFFRDEEVGCLGSRDNDKAFFSDVRFVLQCDRKGNSGFVTTASGTVLCSENFKNDVKDIIGEYGYSFISGMMTDVMALRDSGIEISMANIECGYYNPHSPNEYVVVREVEKCLAMVLDIIHSLDTVYPCSTPKPDYSNWWGKNKNTTKGECWSCLETTLLNYDPEYKVWCCDRCVFEDTPL